MEKEGELEVEAEEEVEVGAGTGDLASGHSVGRIYRKGGTKVEGKVVGGKVAEIEKEAETLAIDHRDRRGVEDIALVGIDAIGISGGVEDLDAGIERQRNRSKAVVEVLQEAKTKGRGGIG